MKKVAVIGDGAWGTTLALLLNAKEIPVTIWGAFPDYVQEVQQTRNNRKFLPNISIPSTILFSSQLQEVIEQSDMIVLATPSQFLQGVLEKIQQTQYQTKSFISVVKGIDLKTFSLMSDLIQSQLGDVPLAVLSGPTIAIEVAKQIPSSAVIASKNEELAFECQQIFSCSYFRLYVNTDIVGVEIAGGLKNVIALAAGVCDGLGFGVNTKSALLARGLTEMIRFGKLFQAQEKTFFGLAGLGDLATTCFSPNSRNRSVGEALGKNKTIEDILAQMNSVAEGVPTAKAVYLMAKEKSIEMPITQAVYQIIYEHKNPATVVHDLMQRTLKAE